MLLRIRDNGDVAIEAHGYARVCPDVACPEGTQEAFAAKRNFQLFLNDNPIGRAHWPEHDMSSLSAKAVEYGFVGPDTETEEAEAPADDPADDPSDDEDDEDDEDE